MSMAAPREVEVTTLAPQRLSRLIGTSRLHDLIDAATRARTALGESRVWNISSTSVGGGVAEMLHNLLGYCLGSGIDARWVVIEGDEGFFEITKRPSTIGSMASQATMASSAQPKPLTTKQ